MALRTVRRPLTDLKPHPRNPRNGDTDAIVESLTVNGQYRAIVTTTDGTILAGNHTYAAAAELGWKHLDCHVLDLDPYSPEALRILLVDNRTADRARYDEALLAELLGELPELVGTGYTPDDLSAMYAEEDAARAELERKFAEYVNSTNIPHYEPTQPAPPHPTDLYDTTRTDELLTSIAAADLDPLTRAFLETAAHRHTVFTYSQIAEFYAHATPQVQRLMEESALVIIDVQDAIRLGYARLSEWIDGAINEDE